VLGLPIQLVYNQIEAWIPAGRSDAAGRLYQ